jgi:FeS assembly SUF system regulator
MIKMSKLADYAFIILTRMVVREGASWAASDLAEKTGLPGPTVAKVMKMLAKGQVVMAQRGALGGYRLSRPANQINVATIIRAVDGPIALTQCVDDSEPDCTVQSFCPLHGGWDLVNRAVINALEGVTLAEMANRGGKFGALIAAVPPEAPRADQTINSVE